MRGRIDTNGVHRYKMVADAGYVVVIAGNFYCHGLPAIHLKGQWLKDAVFETGFAFTVKILNGCLVLIPDSEDIRAMMQQNQQQQAQLTAIRHAMCELIAEYVSAKK
ncbi:SymE family type I addiction module toxin [Providencia sp. Me31A]|uniref:SymE family type I addiction module toxin n=1 Tax=Providencia sp. Me31A TaxID=3392637 RepID=UPI003D2E6603